MEIELNGQQTELLLKAVKRQTEFHAKQIRVHNQGLEFSEHCRTNGRPYAKEQTDLDPMRHAKIAENTKAIELLNAIAQSLTA